MKIIVYYQRPVRMSMKGRVGIRNDRESSPIAELMTLDGLLSRGGNEPDRIGYDTQVEEYRGSGWPID